MPLRCKSYSIHQQPVAWKRAGICGKRFFDAQSRQKLIFGISLKQQHNEEPLFIRPISVDITFFMQQPKEKKLKSIYHTYSPDLDNLEKFLLDAITGVIISDDRIICSIAARKIYDRDPRTEFVITEVE